MVCQSREQCISVLLVRFCVVVRCFRTVIMRPPIVQWFSPCVHVVLTAGNHALLCRLDKSDSMHLRLLQRVGSIQRHTRGHQRALLCLCMLCCSVLCARMCACVRQWVGCWLVVPLCWQVWNKTLYRAKTGVQRVCVWVCLCSCM